jgi:hypothetical protein
VARPLSPEERGFLARHFGASLALDGVRIARSLGRRAWSPYGQRISLTPSCFAGGDARAQIALDDPRAASILAHEALHVWQRQHGVHVTLHGAVLQAGYVLRIRDPYRYDASEDPQHMLAQFVGGNIEQQGKIFEDYVFAWLSGRDTQRFDAVVAHVRGERASDALA